MRLIHSSQRICLFALTMATFCRFESYAQSIAINEDGAAPNPKAMLDIQSTTKGLLAPRMTTAQREAIAVLYSDEGMIVFDTDVNHYMFYTGSMWQPIGGDGLWFESGPGMQNSIANVGIGGVPVAGLPLRVTTSFGRAAEITNSGFYADYALKVKNTFGTAIAAFSGSSEPVLFSPAAIYGYGSDGAHGAFLNATLYGAGVKAQSEGFGPAIDAFAQGSGLAGWFHGGNVHIEDSLGIGISTPASPLHVFSALSGDVARFASDGNTLLRLYRNDIYSGFLQTQSDDFIVGRPSAAGEFGNVVLFNTSMDNSLKLEADGDVGIGVNGSAHHKLRVEGVGPNSLISAEVIYEGENDVRAIEGIATPIGGYGYGGHFTGGYYGVYGIGEGDSFVGVTTGVSGHATGTGGTRIGIRGSATGGITNWAGYFGDGNVYVENKLAIGSVQTADGYLLSVDGKVICEEIKVQNNVSWPDYVFEPDHTILSLQSVEAFISEHKHLPGIPNAIEIEEQGIDVGEMQAMMMEKIEELTLYIIAQDKRIEMLEKTKKIKKL